MQNFSYENRFSLHGNETSFSYEKLCFKTRFEKRYKTTRKWPITYTSFHLFQKVLAAAASSTLNGLFILIISWLFNRLFILIKSHRSIWVKLI